MTRPAAENLKNRNQKSMEDNVGRAKFCGGAPSSSKSGSGVPWFASFDLAVPPFGSLTLRMDCVMDCCENCLRHSGNLRPSLEELACVRDRARDLGAESMKRCITQSQNQNPNQDLTWTRGCSRGER